MIVLTGFMGSGKTSVGKLLSHQLGVDFVDSDDAIQAAQGRSIATIFAEDGEAGFRAIEAAVITELLAGRSGVIALGGGALATASVRAALKDHQVVLLDVELAEALRRIGDDPERPMLKLGDAATLYRARQAAYRDAAEVVVPVTGRTPREIVSDVLQALPKAAGGVGE